MRILPIVYGENVTQPQLEALRFLVADAILVLERNTGRVAAAAPPVAFTPAPQVIDLTRQLRDQPAVIDPLDAQLTPQFGTADVLVVAVLGNARDASGVGRPWGTGQGGSCVVGQWNLDWAITYHEDSAGADDAPGTTDTSSRVGYGGLVAKVLHELGHALGLVHPTDLNTTSTVMGYNPVPIVLGERGTAAFTPDEIARLRAHPALAEVHADFPALVRLIYTSDVQPIVDGRWPAKWALGPFGMFLRDELKAVGAG